VHETGLEDMVAEILAVMLQFNFRENEFWPWFFGGGILWGIIGLIIASTKGRSGWGCCLGCLLGPFGLLLTMLMPEDR
jgi:hypothetical protein